MIRNLVNVIGFQVGWFAAVLGAGNGIPWAGLVIVPAVLVLHFFLSPQRKAEGILILSAGVLGFFVDTVLVVAGVFTPVSYLYPAPWSPPWMVLLWMNFATALNVSLKKLHGKYMLSGVLGAVGGPFAYYSGSTLKATTSIPGPAELLVISVTWASVVPLLYWLAAGINKKHIALDHAGAGD